MKAVFPLFYAFKTIYCCKIWLFYLSLHVEKGWWLCLMRYLHLKTTLGTALRPHNGYNYNI